MTELDVLLKETESLLISNLKSAFDYHQQSEENLRSYITELSEKSHVKYYTASADKHKKMSESIQAAIDKIKSISPKQED